MKSVMTHVWNMIPQAQKERSVFDLSYGHKKTFSENYLYPFYCEEILPGDTISCTSSIFCRMLSPLKWPVMDNMYLETFYFFVPNRLVWENWQKFNGEREPDDEDWSDDRYLLPKILTPDTTGIVNGDLGDHFGLPVGIPEFPVNALPFRAYALIWNEWFRRQDIFQSIDIYKGDTSVTEEMNDYYLLMRMKRPDYFTSCLPWPQKGPGVELPLGTSAPVFGNGYCLGLSDGESHEGLADASITGDLIHDAAVYGEALGHAGSGGTTPTVAGYGVVTKDLAGIHPDYSGLYADLSTGIGPTINTFRMAMQIQRLYERDARGGTRYTEILRTHFGVISPDARLQRPEILGCGRQKININTVTQTAPDPYAEEGTSDPQTYMGRQTAHVTSFGQHGFTKSFVEHGYIIGLVNVRADINYQQGIRKMWTRSTRFDFYWPALSHLGEQEVLEQEIFCNTTSAVDPYHPANNWNETIFGYQERYAEYRYHPSEICGQFRSCSAPLTPDANTLDSWHLAPAFFDIVYLDTAFLADQPPIDRVVAMSTYPHFFMDCFHQVRAARVMPAYSVPGLVDHF